MSKLTNWINKTDSLDIQGIVEKYEQDLTSGSQKVNETSNINNKDEEIWCGSLDDFATRKMQPTAKPELEIKNNIFTNDNKAVEQQPIEAKPIEKEPQVEAKPICNETNDRSNKTLIFGGFSNPEPKQPAPSIPNTPPPLFKPAEVEKPIINKEDDDKRTIQFGVIDKPLVEEEKKPTFKDDVVKRHLEELNQIESKREQEARQEQINRTKPQTQDEIVFDKPNTRLFDSEPSKPKFNTVTIVDKDKEEKASKFLDKDGKPFAMSDAFLKQVEENDFKTIKFQPTASQLSNEQSGIERIDTFTKRLTKIFFNETIKAENLDLTKELNHAKGIEIDNDVLKEKKGFFSKFKKKNKESNK